MPNGRIAPTDAEKACESLVLSLKNAGGPRPGTIAPATIPDRVVQAMQGLLDYGIAAFPVLVRHSNDQDFSYSRAGTGNLPPGYVEQYSVGDVCRQIIVAQVDLALLPYKGRLGADGQMHSVDRYFYASNTRYWINLDAWWAARRNKTLAELRLEAVDWHIQREKAVGFPTPGDEAHYLKPLLELKQLLTKKGDRPRRLGTSNLFEPSAGDAAGHGPLLPISAPANQ